MKLCTRSVGTYGVRAAAAPIASYRSERPGRNRHFHETYFVLNDISSSTRWRSERCLLASVLDFRDPHRTGSVSAITIRGVILPVIRACLRVRYVERAPDAVC